MSIPILIAVFCIIILYAGFRKRHAPPGLSAAELKERINQGDAMTMIDVRNPDEFNGPAGHIPGAELKPLHQIGTWADSVAKMPAPVILICHIGNRSRSAARILASKGIEAINLTGGMAAWHRQGYSTE